MAIETVKQFHRLLRYQDSVHLTDASNVITENFQYKKRKIETHTKVNGCKQPTELNYRTQWHYRADFTKEIKGLFWDGSFIAKEA